VIRFSHHMNIQQTVLLADDWHILVKSILAVFSWHSTTCVTVCVL